MTMKMLICADGSDNSKIALDYGIYIAPKFDATIAGLHVIDASLIQGPLTTDISGAVGMQPYDGFFEAIETSLKEKATYKNGNLVSKFLAFNENGSAASGENSNYSDNDGIWEEKDVADLLQDLKHFDQKNK